jgi:hypothetical protein
MPIADAYQLWIEVKHSVKTAHSHSKLPSLVFSFHFVNYKPIFKNFVVKFEFYKKLETNMDRS